MPLTVYTAVIFVIYFLHDGQIKIVFFFPYASKTLKHEKPYIK